MTLKTTRRSVLLGTAAAALGAPLIAKGAAEFQLKYANNSPVTHPLYIRITEAVERIKKETNGRVEIQIFPNNQLGSDTDMLSQLRSGAIDFFTLSGLILATLVPVASINGLGFVWENYGKVWPAMDGELGGLIRKQIEKAMREEIATVAFCSDGGWFAATGFEVADARPRSVFQCAENAQPSQPNADLRAFIKEVNAIVKARPALGLFNWTERIFLNGKPELAIFKTRDEREPGKPVYLKIANTDPDKHPLLTDDDMKKLGPADRVYICGGVQMQNPDQAVTPAVIAAQPPNDVGSVRSAAAR